ncbi:hypothetical protein EMCRGX_G018218 [Ephydatia muelleri]
MDSDRSARSDGSDSSDSYDDLIDLEPLPERVRQTTHCENLSGKEERQQVLAELHESHPGINKMKGLARGYVWWPNMDKEIEDVVKQCDTWPFMGHMFWVMSIDAHSNGSRLHEVDSCSTYCGTFKSTFAIHGIPRKIVTDNGPSFAHHQLSYCWVVALVLDLIFCILTLQVEWSLDEQHRSMIMMLVLSVNATLWEIVSVTWPLSYTVKIESGVVRRHINHMRARHNSQVDSSEDVNMDSPNDVTSGPSCTTAVSPSLLRMELFLPLIHLCLGHVFNVFNLLLNYLPPFHNFRSALPTDALRNCFVLQALPADRFENSIVPQEVEQYRTFLTATYECAHAAEDQWPPVQFQEYIKLATVVKVQDFMKENKCTKVMMNGKLRIVLRNKQSIAIEKIGRFEDGTLASCIIMEGIPGVGKSTLAWQLGRHWGKKEILQHFQLVIVLRVRDERVQKAHTISELFYHPDPDIQQSVSKWMASTLGENVLLILDGYDELSSELQIGDLSIL